MMNLLVRDLPLRGNIPVWAVKIHIVGQSSPVHGNKGAIP